LKLLIAWFFIFIGNSILVRTIVPTLRLSEIR
jgi:hypothetical protein